MPMFVTLCLALARRQNLNKKLLIVVAFVNGQEFEKQEMRNTNKNGTNAISKFFNRKLLTFTKTSFFFPCDLKRKNSSFIRAAQNICVRGKFLEHNHLLIQFVKGGVVHDAITVQ